FELKSPDGPITVTPVIGSATGTHTAKADDLWHTARISLESNQAQLRSASADQKARLEQVIARHSQSPRAEVTRLENGGGRISTGNARGDANITYDAAGVITEVNVGNRQFVPKDGVLRERYLGEELRGEITISVGALEGIPKIVDAEGRTFYADGQTVNP